jgi:hypothetical protein
MTKEQWEAMTPFQQKLLELLGEIVDALKGNLE